MYLQGVMVMLVTSLEILFQFARILHILGGFLALLVFWIPMITRKGGKAHARVGWIYVWAMGVVAVTAWYMGLWRITLDPGRTAESTAFAYFLIFIALLSSSSAWYGIRVLRFKQRPAAHKGRLDLLIPSMLVLGGIAISWFGWMIGFPLLQWFPLIGILLGSQQVYYWLTPPKNRMHWWFEHLGGMLGCCIATITAFTVFGAPRLLQVDSVHPLVWFIPTFVMTPLIIGYNAYYRRKFKV